MSPRSVDVEPGRHGKAPGAGSHVTFTFIADVVFPCQTRDVPGCGGNEEDAANQQPFSGAGYQGQQGGKTLHGSLEMASSFKNQV